VGSTQGFNYSFLSEVEVDFDVFSRDPETRLEAIPPPRGQTDGLTDGTITTVE